VITSLKPGEVFVFGSNLAGRHGGGAARQAHADFGAEYGIGEGLTGQCYAFPTLGHRLEQLPWRTLQTARDNLYSACRQHQDKTFLLTKVGCGIAGYPESDMAALFADPPPNFDSAGGMEWRLKPSGLTRSL